MIMKNRLIGCVTAIAFAFCTIGTAKADDPTTSPGPAEAGTERTIVVGETTHTYVLPSPPTLQLTPPAILQNPPATARIYPIMTRELAPFNGVLFDGEASAWLTTEREMIPNYLETYSSAIRAQMVAWAYMELEQAHLRMATEQEDARLEINSLERQIESTRRLRRRSTLRPILLTGFIVLTVGIAATSTAYIVGSRNH